MLDGALRRHCRASRHIAALAPSSYWLEGSASLDGAALAEAAETLGVLVEPGEVFFMGDDPPRNYLRLGFASISRDRIEAGIAALGKAARSLGA